MIDKILLLSSVLLGSIITAGFDYFKTWQQSKLRISEKCFDIRLDAYRHFLEYFSNLEFEIKDDILQDEASVRSPLYNINDIKRKIVEFHKLSSKYIVFIDNKTEKYLKEFEIKIINDWVKLEAKNIKKINLKEYRRLISAVLESIKCFFETHS